MCGEARLISGIMKASTSPDITQLATDCSRYWTDLRRQEAREESG